MQLKIVEEIAKFLTIKAIRVDKDKKYNLAKEKLGEYKELITKANVLKCSSSSYGVNSKRLVVKSWF